MRATDTSAPQHLGYRRGHVTLVYYQTRVQEAVPTPSPPGTPAAQPHTPRRPPSSLFPGSLPWAGPGPPRPRTSSVAHRQFSTQEPLARLPSLPRSRGVPPANPHLPTALSSHVASCNALAHPISAWQSPLGPLWTRTTDDPGHFFFK